MSKIYFTNGRSTYFKCSAGEESIEINKINKNRCTYMYKYSEIYEYLLCLLNIYGCAYFPLGNNINELFYVKDADSLGSVIYRISRNTPKVQGSSYLGVVLQNAKILHWNNLDSGIKWKINEVFLPLDVMKIKNAIINSLEST